MDITLTAELEKFVAESVTSGRYNSPTELVHASLRRFEEEQQWLDCHSQNHSSGTPEGELRNV